MKNKMPLDGLGLGHDSGSVHCDMLKMLCFRTAWGGVTFIVFFLCLFFPKRHPSPRNFLFLCPPSPFIN